MFRSGVLCPLIRPLVLCGALCALLPATFHDAAASERRNLSPRKMRIARFSLVDAATGKPLPGMKFLEDGQTINLATLPASAVNLYVRPKPQARVVRFSLNGELTNRDRKRPYALFEGRRGSKTIWPITTGTHTVQAVAYPVVGYRSSRGRTFRRSRTTLTLHVVDELVVDQSLPPVPERELWERNMVEFGERYCDPEEIAQLSTYEGGVWYYDGLRMYLQMAQYLNDPRWEVCAEYVRDVYRTYVLESEGNIPGWRVFSEGLYRDFVRSGDELSRQAVRLLATRSGFAYSAGSPDYRYSRENALIIESYLTAEQVGVPLEPSLHQAVNNSLIHLADWRDGRADTVQPYLVGMTLESLIRYYERTRDARIPDIVFETLDWLWDGYWEAENGAFAYIRCAPSVTAPECDGLDQGSAADLNLLIAPAYAWAWRRTDEPRFLERGDLAFAEGVRRAYLFGGKQFTQNYRWSFDYLRWRLTPRS